MTNLSESSIVSLPINNEVFPRTGKKNHKKKGGNLTEIHVTIQNCLRSKHKGKGYRISNSIRISMEIAMTDKSVLIWLHEVLGVGTVTDKPRKGLRKNGTKYLMQYRWRCTFRDAYYVCCLIWPFAHTKLPKVQQIIEHYARQRLKDGADVVNLDEYKMKKQMMWE